MLIASAKVYQMSIERLVEVEKEVQSVKEYIVPEMERRFEHVDEQFKKVDDRFDKLDERIEYQAMNTERIVDLTYEIKTILQDTKRVESEVENHEKRLDFLEKRHAEGKRGRDVADYVIKVFVATIAISAITAVWKILGG
ncbi:hypothetical protein AB832_08105 [Flavobacteriaceae bacterium (ex Bugula neritina AB1)]|nr:hypothetical protein AB832_08105 [Flavobacteriaceae bacterium (ex Bugula neritina AB1)]